MEVLPDAVVRRSYLEQAQLSQVHRWVALALGEPSAAQASELLAEGAAGDEVQVSGLRIEAVTPSVEDLVTHVACVCASAPAAAQAADLRLSFAAREADFPRITAVALAFREAAGVGTPDPDALMRSRILSLKHRWHGLVENPLKRAEPFAEIVTEDFAVDWGRGSLSGLDELGAWVQSTASIAAARHDITAFDCAEAGAGQYTARFEFAWSGLSLDGEPMQAASEHHWLVKEDLEARFPRIARMDVNLRVPFHVVPR